MKKQKKLVMFLNKLVVVLFVACAVLFICFSDMGNAAGRKGTVSGCPGLGVFKNPSKAFESVTTVNGESIFLPSGYEVMVISETFADEINWYYISFKYDNGQTYEGYARAQYIVLDKDNTQSSMTDDEFEQYLVAEGFPEAYRNYLMKLHAEHPMWIFEAQITNLDWEASVKAESVVGKNLIPNSSPSSWKSMEKGAYDYSTNSWVVFDGKTWVAASKELIAYYMDPRNFLNDVNIFQFEVLSYNSSYHTSDGIEAILDGSFMEGSYVDTDGWSATYTEAFIYAAEQSGVSPYHLASRALQELGYDGSSSVSGTVEGYEGIFNFYNIGATSSSNPILKGLEFASQINEDYFMPWNTKWKSIAGGALYLGRRYINVGQDTLYLQKFNVQGSNPYNHQYMTNVQAPSAEAGKLAEAYETSLERAIVFKIPVYLNMPTENAPLPTGTGAANASLVNLEIEGYVLTPTFHKDTLEYDLVLDEYVSSIKIKASVADPVATVTGAGDVKLVEGKNKINVTVSTQNGNSRVYTINVAVPYSKSTIVGDGYAVMTGDKILQGFTLADGQASTYIYGFEVGMTVKEVLATFTPIDCTVKIVKADRTDNDGVLATGNILQIISSDGNTILKELPVVIFGDVNGDGLIDGKDMLYVCRHVLQVNILPGVYAEAADVRWDTTVYDEHGTKSTDITGVDMLYIQRHLLDIAYISQR
ncbi:MAG: mannosyl-glycoprotein endo-beta-N-acetylglucosamidase [Lachnospiraceae bacterium]|nr:mannosyl-glycoprotein endo-beta-N-acetylglucosamidase [Lachnospiraceae bacterium]